MTVLVTGGAGDLGSRVVRAASDAGHEVRVMVRAGGPATRANEVAADLATGAGLDGACAGVSTIVHAASNPANAAVVDVQGTRRLIEAARAAGVAHVVYISIVGVDAIPYEYYGAKLEAERIVAGGGVPWSIVRATQFHGFVSQLLGQLARTPLVMPLPRGFAVQPVEIVEVAARLVRSIAAASGRVEEFAGPEVLPVDELARQWLSARRDRKPVVRIPLPGALAAAFRAGHNTSASAERGCVTWSQWLRAEYGG